MGAFNLCIDLMHVRIDFINLLDMLIIIILSFLGIGAKKDGHIVFSTVFFVNLVGAVLVTVNAKFLGGRCGFFQNLSLIGYSILPITLASIVLVVGERQVQNNILIKLFISLGAFFWSTMSKKIFLCLRPFLITT